MVETKEIAWDLTQIFKTAEEIQQTIEKAQQEAEMIKKDYYGKINSINTTANDLIRLFERIESLKEKSEGLFFYGKLKVSADQTNEEALELFNTVKNFRLEIKKKIAFVEIELGGLLKNDDSFLQSSILEN
ncbi:MAG: hypothetical protein ACFFDT_34400, partial [Candidatus Hodarchaeota archaeon]